MNKRLIKNAMAKTKPWNKRFIMSDKCQNLMEAMRDYNWLALEGAAQCGKSSILALLFSIAIMSSGPDDNLFLAIGYTIASAKTNIMNVSGFGLKSIFDGHCCEGKFNGKDCLYINVNGVTKVVVFVEAANTSSNNSWHGFSVSGAACDEMDRWHQNSVDELKQRIQAHPDAKVIISLNSTNINHPIYKFFDELIERGKMYLENFTFMDNPGLSDAQKQDIMSSYDPDSVYYKRFVLGQRVSVEGLIYKLYDHTFIDHSKFNYTKYVVTADPGITKSATAFACVGLCFNNVTQQLEAHLLFEYNQRNVVITNPNYKTTTDVANDYADFVLMCMKRLERAPEAVYVDTSPDFLVECQKAFASRNIGHLRIQYALKSLDDMKVEERIKWSSTALFRGLLKFDNTCEHTIKEFKETVYNPKELLKGNEIYWDEPANEAAPHIDSIDACLYGYRHFKDTLDEQFRYR